MLLIKEKILAEFTKLNFPSVYSYNSIELNPNTFKEVYTLDGATLTFTLPLPLKDGMKYYAKVNYTSDDGSISITGWTGTKKYFTQSGTSFSIQIVATNKVWLDSIEIYELEGFYAEIIDENDILLSKFSGVLTDIENIVEQHSLEFSIRDNLRYPNNNLVSYFGELNGQQGNIIVGNITDEITSITFVSDVINLVDKLKEFTLKQTSFASEVFEITESTAKNNDSYCHYNFVNKGNLADTLCLCTDLYFAQDYNLTLNNVLPSLKVVTLLGVLFDKIGYTLDGNVLDTNFFQSLSYANYDNYKDADITDSTSKLDDDYSLTATFCDYNMSNLNAITLTDISGNFTTAKLTQTYNSFGLHKIKAKVQATTVTSDSDGNEYSDKFSLTLAFKIIIRVDNLTDVYSDIKVIKIVNYETKDVEIAFDLPYELINGKDYTLHLYSEVASHNIQNGVDTFNDFDYTNIVDINVSGDWEFNENDTIRTNTEYELKKLMPNMTAFDFLKLIMTNFNLQFDLTNKVFTLYNFNEYFITQSSEIDLTNKIDIDSKEILMPSEYLPQIIEWKYNDEIGQHDYYYNKIKQFTSQNCNDKKTISFNHRIIRQSDKDINYIVKDDVWQPFINPYIETSIEGDYLILQEVISSDYDLKVEDGSIVALNSINTSSLKLGNKTLAFGSLLFTFTDGIKKYYFDNYLNSLMAINGYKLKVNALITLADYNAIKKNTVVIVEDEAFIIDTISEFNENKLTKFELIKSTLNHKYTGDTEIDVEEITFNPVGKYINTTVAVPYTTSGMSMVVTKPTTTSTCKIKVTATSGYYQYDNSGTWTSLAVNDEFTLTSTNTTFSIRLNSAIAGTHILSFSSTIGNIESNTTKWTYILTDTGGAISQTGITGNVQDGDIEILNEEVHNDL